jgi:E3 ubiquitin-protein ligase SIAH1
VIYLFFKIQVQFISNLPLNASNFQNQSTPIGIASSSTSSSNSGQAHSTPTPINSVAPQAHHSYLSNASNSNLNQSATPTTNRPAPSSSVHFNNELLSLFECPVCFEFCLPPILQCESGHIVCSSCRPKLTCCPACRVSLGNIRNLSMEKLANSLQFPCKYFSNGCMQHMAHDKKHEHEDACEFRPFQCPCPGASCKWQGLLDQVMPHLIQSHNNITTLQGEDIVFLATDIGLPGAIDWVMMQSCFGHHFMLVLEKQVKHDQAQQFYAVVQLIGTRKQAEQFAYRLELNGQRRRLTWESTPRSIHDGVQQAFVNSDCLVFDSSTAQLFADSGNLGINVTISLW